MVKSIDYSFPKVYPNAETLFTVEINKLTTLWNVCCSNFEQNAREEAAYTNGGEYLFLENQGPVIAVATCGITSGTACLLGGISLQLPPMFLAGMASIGSSMWGWKYVIDATNQMNRFVDCRINSHRTVEKIERCVRLINQVGELFTAWEIAKKSPSIPSLNLLFKSFKHVQKAELGLLTDSIDPTLPFLLMDNICEETTSDLKIIKEWKDFTEGKTSQPPEFKYFKAPISDYHTRREVYSELQVASKISRLKNYINQAASGYCLNQGITLETSSLRDK